MATKLGAPVSFGARLKALREAAGFTQEELATIAGLSVHGVSALERGERRRPQVGTIRALSSALDLDAATRDALLESARAPVHHAPVDEFGPPLPLAPTVLLGRDADVQTLRQWLSDSAVRLITLTGTGGAGKTRLALELARLMATEGGTRVLFVSLADVRDPAFVAPAIAEALGLRDNSAHDLLNGTRAACGGHQLLLVLDNFEQVLDAAPLIADLLTAVGCLRVLATSRAPLRLRGEREYVVGPLALDADSDEFSPADLARSPAVQLFVERVRDVHPDFCLTPVNGPVVAAICRRLDALPLALELAAPWMKVLTADDLLRRLTQNVLLPAVSPRDLPERQQTMNATVAWSYQCLNAKEQRAFRRLGALPGRFSIDAAEAVLAGPEGAGNALAKVAGLIDKSLLLRAESSVATRPRYQMLETVRAYAAVELASAGERDDALDALACYCTTAAVDAAEGLSGCRQIEWLDRVRDDLEIYRTAMTWLIERGRPADAAGIAWRLMFFWVIRGHAAEGLRWCEHVLKSPSLPPAAESQALVGAGAMWFTQGELDRARTRLTSALALAEGIGDMNLAVLAENLLGLVEYGVGNLDRARDRFTRSVDGFRALAQPWGIANATSGLAGVALAAGDFDEGERLLDELTPVLQHAGPWFVLRALYVRALLAVRRGNPDQAIALTKESLACIQTLHDNFVVVYTLVPLAAAAVLKGDDEWAARILGVRDAVTDRTGATVVDKSVLDLREQSERQVRTRLGPERWARAYAAGRLMSIDQLMENVGGPAIESRRR